MNEPKEPSGNAVPWLEFMGFGRDAERLEANADAFKEIFFEIAKLRALDLGDIHPAVVFDPRLTYRDL